MNEFAVSAGDKFSWRHPKATTRFYELSRREEPFGTLEFRSIWGTLAWAKNPIQDWSLKRMGFLNPHITIRMADAESDYALYYPKIFGGGTFQMSDGRPFAWEPVNFWRTKWRFLNKSGLPVLSFAQGSEEFKLSELFKFQATAKLESSRVTNLEFSLLINLGFYLMVLNQSDTAAATAAASSS